MRFHVHAVPAGAAALTAVRLHPGGTRTVTLSGVGEIGVWRGDGSRILLTDGSRANRGLELTADGRYAIAHGFDELRVLAVDSGRILFEDSHRFGTLMPDGAHLVTHRGSEVQLWRVGGMEAVATFPLRLGKSGGGYHPAMEDMTAEEIDAATPNATVEACIPLDARRVAVSTTDWRTFVFDLGGGEAPRVLKARLAALHPDGRTDLCADPLDRMGVIDVETEARCSRFLPDALEAYGPRTIAFLSDGCVVSACRNDVRCWDPGTWTAEAELSGVLDASGASGHRVKVDRIVPMRDGQRVALAGQARPVPVVWRPGGEPRPQAPPFDREESGVIALAPLGDGLVAAVRHGGVAVWDGTGAIVSTVECDPCGFTLAADGRIATSDGRDLLLLGPLPD